MKFRLAAILAVMFFGVGMLAHADGLTGDDLIQKIKTIVDTDFDEEDQLKPIMGDYAKSINDINVLIQKKVDQEVIVQKISKLNVALDL